MEIGNTNSNLTNNGYVTAKNDWVYFNNCNLGLYKMKTDSSEKVKINDDPARFINIVGDYLYYVGDGNNIIKIKTDGSEKKVICNKRCLFVTVIEEWIYFIELLETAYNGYVCKMKSDGTSYVRLNNCKYSFCLNVVGDWIYYIDQDPSKDWDHKNRLFRIKTDGSHEQKINDISCLMTFIATDECVYQDDCGTMIKTDHKGVVIEKFSMPFGSFSFCVQDDWIYYFGDCSDTSEKSPLFKMKSNGTNNQKIIDIKFSNSSLYVSGDWLYYTTPEYLKINGAVNEYMQLYRVKVDGSNNEKCASDLKVVKNKKTRATDSAGLNHIEQQLVESGFEKIETEKSCAPKQQNSYAPSLLAGIGLGLFSALIGKPSRRSKMPSVKHTSGTKTGRKRGR